MSWRKIKITLNTKTVQLLAVLAVLLFATHPVHAQADLGLNDIAGQTALGTTDLKTMISNIVNIALGFLGIIAVLIIMFGGFKWMTAGGEAENVQKAKRLITNGIIGLAIILMSWSIAYFIIRSIGGATGVIGGPGGGAGGAGGFGSFSDALGSGSLASHYPGRNAIGVPRNAPIIVTFKDPIDTTTIIDGADLNGTLKTSAVRILKKDADGTFGSLLEGGKVTVIATSDKKTFTMRPTAGNELGSANEITTYKVELTPNIKKVDPNNREAFGPNGYYWNFDVSTVLDKTPPKMESVFPRDASTVARNAVITLTFDEPIDPNSGMVNGAVTVTTGTGAPIAGITKYSNNYKTVEFVPSLACGTSSCGTTVYCLPASSDIRVKVKPGTISQALGAPTASMPYDGVVDVVGNSFDGNGNGAADGAGDPPTKDTYTISFKTDAQIRTAPPVITAIVPDPSAANVAPEAPVTVTFSPFMQFSTLSTTNIMLRSTAAPMPSYWTESANTTGDTTVMTIRHGLFSANAAYQPEISSNVKDAYQNCFNPVSGPRCSTTADKPLCCPDVNGNVVPTARPADGSGVCPAP